VLRLASRTDPAWVERALARLDDVLLDHAHCEKKAAGAAVRLLFSYPEARFLQEPLARLAREELAHFEEVLGHLRRRGVPFARQRPAPYAGRLHAAAQRDEPRRRTDLLLIAGLIEARSCERLGLLAAALPDRELAAFYRGLGVVEARHHALYWELATRDAPAGELRARCAHLAAVEAEVLATPGRLVRLHT